MFSSNLESGRKSVSTFDFSTLYTSIPHDQLMCNLRQFVERIFSIKDKKYMVCNLFNKCAYFSDSDNIPKSYIVFNKSNLVECINYLIDNAFVVFNNHVYRQVIGIPMGTNSGPHVANIYLHQYYEYFRLLFDRGKNDLLARLGFVFRFQDDLISFNAGGIRYQVPDFTLVGGSFFLPKTQLLHGTNWWVYCPFSRKTVSTWY